jgi:hypothetical protein
MKQQPPLRPGLIPLRGPSGRLYGYLDTRRMVIECKRKNEAREEIDISPYVLRKT